MDMPSQRTFGSAAVVAAPPVVAHKLSAVDEAKSFPLVPLSVDSMATGTFLKAARKPGLSNIYLARRYCTAALLSVAGPIGVLKARLTASSRKSLCNRVCLSAPMGYANLPLPPRVPMGWHLESLLAAPTSPTMAAWVATNGSELDCP